MCIRDRAVSVGNVAKFSSTASSTAPVDNTDSGALKIKNAKAAPSITLLLDSILIVYWKNIKVLKITPNVGEYT